MCDGMSYMSFLITEVEIKTEMMTKRTTNRLLNDIHRENGEHHAIHTMPKHFEFGAYQRYKYKRRSAKYTREKFAKHGHRIPNVMEGDMMRIVLATARGGVTATAGGWRMKARGTQKHRMWAQSKVELEQISESEIDEYGDRNMRKFVRSAGTAKYKVRTRKVIRGK